MMTRKLIFRSNNQEGAAAIEFAIILPLLLLVIFGVIEFGLALFNQQVITNAAREGARRGVIMRANRDTNSPAAEDLEIKARVMEFAESYLVTFGDNTFGEDKVSVYSVLDGSGDPVDREIDDLDFEDNLTVKVEFPYTFLFLSTIGIGPIDLTSISTMKME